MALAAPLAHLVEKVVGAVRQLPSMRVPVQRSARGENHFARYSFKRQSVVRRRDAQQLACWKARIAALILVVPAVLHVHRRRRLELADIALNVHELARVTQRTALWISWLVVAAQDQARDVQLLWRHMRDGVEWDLVQVLELPVEHFEVIAGYSCFRGRRCTVRHHAAAEGVDALDVVFRYLGHVFLSLFLFSVLRFLFFLLDFFSSNAREGRQTAPAATTRNHKNTQRARSGMERNGKECCHKNKAKPLPSHHAVEQQQMHLPVIHLQGVCYRRTSSFFFLFTPSPVTNIFPFSFFSFYRWNRLPSSFLYLYVLVVRPAHRRIVFQSGAVGYKKIEEREKIRRESRMHSLLCEENTSPSLSVGRKTKNEKWRKRTGSRIVERKIEWH